MSTDEGAMALVMAAMVGVLAVVVMATAGLGLAYSARAQAQTAADASALAAAVSTYPPAGSGHPARQARGAAAANAATLVSCRCPVDSSLSPRVAVVVTRVTVDVPVFGEMALHATARAEFDPLRWLGR